jgi:predicted RNase H-like nuclease
VPACHSNKTEAGFRERLDVLDSFFPQASEAVTEALSRIPRNEAHRDDIVDAMINAVAAAFPPDRIRTLPRKTARDSTGLMMGISYAEPLCGDIGSELVKAEKP